MFKKILKKTIKTYYKLLDEKLQNWTIMVLVISAFIISTWLITKENNITLYTKSNILDINNIENNTIHINWVKYELILKNN